MRAYFIDHEEGGLEGAGATAGAPHIHCQFLPLLIAAGSAILAKKSADQANSTAKSAGNRQLDIENRQLDLAENQDARAGQLYNDYRTTYEPRQRQLVGEVFDSNLTSPETAAARATTDVRKAVANSQQINERGLRRLGVDPSSGSFAATRRDVEVANAGLEASERGFARRETRDSNFGRQLGVLQLGQGLPSTAGGLTSSAGGILGNVNASASRRLERAQDLSAASGAAFGTAVGQAGTALFNAWKGRGGGMAGGYADQAAAAGVS